MARIFTVVGSDGTRVYNGFTHLPDSKGHLPSFMAVVMFDGEPELHAIDWIVLGNGDHYPCPNAIEELKRFYMDQYERSVDVFTYSMVAKR